MIEVLFTVGPRGLYYLCPLILITYSGAILHNSRKWLFYPKKKCDNCDDFVRQTGILQIAPALCFVSMWYFLSNFERTSIIQAYENTTYWTMLFWQSFELTPQNAVYLIVLSLVFLYANLIAIRPYWTLNVPPECVTPKIKKWIREYRFFHSSFFYLMTGIGIVFFPEIHDPAIRQNILICMCIAVGISLRVDIERHSTPGLLLDSSLLIGTFTLTFAF